MKSLFVSMTRLKSFLGAKAIERFGIGTDVMFLRSQVVAAVKAKRRPPDRRTRSHKAS